MTAENDGELYLDHNATAAMRPEAIEAMLRWLGRPANAASIHGHGALARAAVEAARAQLAQLLNCRSRDVVFTSGATEANNLALRATARNRRLIVSAIEHPSVLNTARALEQDGSDLVLVQPNHSGVVPPEAFGKGMFHAPALVSVMLANNETGVLNDLRGISAVTAGDVLVHTDATQAVGRIPVDIEDLDVDLLSLSAHKFGGPQGTGALIVRRQVPLHPTQTGGGHENGRRAGTLNVAGIVGMGAAAAAAASYMDQESAHILRVRDHFEQQVLALDPSSTVLGSSVSRLPNTSLVMLPGAQAEAIMTRCPQLAISHGSACASGAPGPSHVLRAMHIPDSQAECALRISFGPRNTHEDAQRAARQLTAAAADIRAHHTLGGFA